jgi:hypothetical protein
MPMTWFAVIVFGAIPGGTMSTSIVPVASEAQCEGLIDGVSDESRNGRVINTRSYCVNVPVVKSE